MKRPRYPAFEADSYGARIEALVPRDAAWDESDASAKWLTRMTTWTLWPHRYWAVEHATRRHVLPGLTRTEHCMYRIAMMSAVRQDGNRELNQWYIVQRPQDNEEVVCYSENIVLPTPAEEAASGNYAESLTFAIDNGLIAPNDQDLLRLGLAIAVGEERGFDRVN